MILTAKCHEKDKIMENLKTINDLELGLNIVDIRQVYDIKTASNSISAPVVMTLTTPGSPIHDTITEGYRHILHGHEDVECYHNEVVWTPLWNPSMIREEGKKFPHNTK